MADKKNDPTIKSDSDTPGADASTARASDGAVHVGYEDNPDKPDPTSIAQIQVLSTDEK